MASRILHHHASATGATATSRLAFRQVAQRNSSPLTNNIITKTISSSSSSKTTTSSRARSMGIGSCIGVTLATTGLAFRSSTLFDYSSSSSAPFSSSSAAAAGFSNSSRGKKGDEDDRKANLMKQLSSGSMAGFVTGVLISVFSRTLVLLLGVGVVVVQVAARYGINIVEQLRLKQRLGNNKSRILAALERDPVFKVSFGIFFALSAFFHF
ncbi:hypothetical protein F5Y17DRAFT_97618 [Xylariaceae sp. FL0594]|nr:hypothetical protein F5Y17DRAFT_97618 [Xylariaceae sp. FL0594]